MTAQSNVSADSEEAFLAQVAPGLTRLGPRYWSAEHGGAVSYPTAAQAKLAAIEETSYWFLHRNEIIGSMVDRFPPSGLVVDIGGGNGFVSLGLHKRGVATILLEPGRDGADVAHGRGLTVVRGVLKPDMFAAGQVPAIGLFDVIEHIEDDAGFLGMVHTSLVAGGYVYITVPALRMLWSSDDVFAGHHRRYSQKSLATVLSRAGFEVLAVSAFFSLLVPPILLLRAVPSLLGLRRVETDDDAFSHHAPSPGMASAMLRALAFERAAIARGWSIPVGSSLVAVAYKAVG